MAFGHYSHSCISRLDKFYTPNNLSAAPSTCYNLSHPCLLSLLQGLQTREVVHLHYLAWPDYGVPSEVFPIFNLIDRMNLLRKSGDHGPPVIHCRWGPRKRSHTPGVRLLHAFSFHIIEVVPKKFSILYDCKGRYTYQTLCTYTLSW